MLFSQSRSSMYWKTDFFRQNDAKTKIPKTRAKPHASATSIPQNHTKSSNKDFASKNIHAYIPCFIPKISVISDFKKGN